MDVIRDAKKYALAEKSPPELFLLISEKKALELCDIYKKADRKIVNVGVLLMDIKVSEALKNNIVEKHVEMSAAATKEFLKKYELSEHDKEKIMNCVEAHHKDVPFKGIEAEICANADCYRFLHPRGFFYYLTLLGGERAMEFNKVLDQAEKKLDEKYKIISLPECKEELVEYYQALKKYIKEARNI